MGGLVGALWAHVSLTGWLQVFSCNATPPPAPTAGWLSYFNPAAAVQWLTVGLGCQLMLWVTGAAVAIGAFLLVTTVARFLSAGWAATLLAGALGYSNRELLKQVHLRALAFGLPWAVGIAVVHALVFTGLRRVYVVRDAPWRPIGKINMIPIVLWGAWPLLSCVAGLELGVLVASSEHALGSGVRAVWGVLALN